MSSVSAFVQRNLDYILIFYINNKVMEKYNFYIHKWSIFFYKLLIIIQIEIEYLIIVLFYVYICFMFYVSLSDLPLSIVGDDLTILEISLSLFWQPWGFLVWVLEYYNFFKSGIIKKLFYRTNKVFICFKMPRKFL